MSKPSNILGKIALTVVLVYASMIETFIGYSLFGALVGRIFNPSMHKHEYACACSVPPILTEAQAIVSGIIFLVGLMIAVFYILRKLKFSLIELVIALLVILGCNLFITAFICKIMSTQVSG